ncbi:MAG: hypothetical protein JJV89_05890, partial [Desulfosarcina sp.]|nr:hypothetical protein [Desulfobacterales bacterium]
MTRFVFLKNIRMPALSLAVFFMLTGSGITEQVIKKTKGVTGVVVEKDAGRKQNKIDRDPTKISSEIEAQMEEVEPPELMVTGVMEISGKKPKAVIELNLDDFEGMVVIEPGMRVSIPKPNRDDSESERWMTYFTVKRISHQGIHIILENG